MTSASECTPMRVIGKLDTSVVEERVRQIMKAAAYTTPCHWAAERALAQTKWFDYRFLSPVDATLKFVGDYQRAFRVKWKEINSEEAELKRGIASGGLWHNRKEFKEFWNARFHADSLGIDYYIYCSTNMERALRRAKQTRLLRPGQMRSEDCVRAVTERWEEELAGSRWLSELPHYREENYCALPDQIAHQEHVAQTARKRSNPRIALAAAINGARVLPTNRAEEMLGTERVRIALESWHGVSSPLPTEIVPDEQLIPSCFGLPAPLDVDADPCSRCPLAEQCEKVSQSTLALVVARYGTDNPDLAHRRAMGRDRIRRFRERKRLARAAVLELEAERHVEAV